MIKVPKDIRSLNPATLVAALAFFGIP